MALGGSSFKHTDVDTIACTLALAIAGAAFWVGVKPALHSEEDTRRLGSQMSLSNQQLEDAQSQYRKVRQEIDTCRARLAELAIVLDAPDQLASRQDEVSKVFSEAGLSINQLSVGAVERGELLDVIPFRLSGSGAFPDVVATMHTIREVFPDMAVTVFQIGSAGGAGDEGVGFSFDIAWYVGHEDADQR
ncbi:hypothetical protein MNBD_PLANCTO03-2394 [hydrothermal vent metagenome]|uniref:Type IV pilus biogenesis protein PilO n=1 Tax=hydrothermal vent metagenome TaxID=652676 RepID=A0A3B1DDR1_9ZZZZ